MDERITEQYVQYNQLKTSIKKKVLKHQRSIQTHQTIPNKHKPVSQLIPNNGTQRL